MKIIVLSDIRLTGKLKNRLEVPALRAQTKRGDNHPLVLVSPKSTNTQSKFINITSPNTKIMATLKTSTGIAYPTLTCLSAAHLVRTFQSLENESESKASAVDLFGNISVPSKKRSLSILSL